MKTWGDNIKERMGLIFVRSTEAAEYRKRWKGKIMELSVVPQ